jgi:hypothetical protein
MHSRVGWIHGAPTCESPAFGQRAALSVRGIFRCGPRQRAMPGPNGPPRQAGAAHIAKYQQPLSSVPRAGHGRRPLAGPTPAWQCSDGTVALSFEVGTAAAGEPREHPGARRPRRHWQRPPPRRCAARLGLPDPESEPASLRSPSAPGCISLVGGPGLTPPPRVTNEPSRSSQLSCRMPQTESQIDSDSVPCNGRSLNARSEKNRCPPRELGRSSTQLSPQ